MNLHESLCHINHHQWSQWSKDPQDELYEIRMCLGCEKTEVRFILDNSFKVVSVPKQIRTVYGASRYLICRTDAERRRSRSGSLAPFGLKSLSKSKSHFQKLRASNERLRLSPRTQASKKTGDNR